jgi:Transposase DDE domain
MSVPRMGSSTHDSSYRDSLLQAINRHLPRRLFDGGRKHCNLRWSERLLVLCILLMTWSVADTLADRFDEARRTLVKMFPGRRRAGRTYSGFMAALRRGGDTLLQKVADHLRGEVRMVAAQKHWSYQGFVPFGADGSKIECAKTATNEREFGCAGKNRSTPQQFITTLLHLPSGVMWDFRCGPARSSERAHLREMLNVLPADALLIADAGFTGYELLKAITGSGKHLLIRVGSNVRLLKKLGYAVEEHRQTVYLWPDEQQRRQQPPLVLRLITLIDGRNRKMHLLASMLDAARMSDELAGALYVMRWGVELHYRALKQTLRRRKLTADAPTNARLELRWAMMALWLLSLMGTGAILHAGGNPRRLSVATALRRLRRAMHRPIVRCGRNGLERQLARAVQDNYQRRGSKKARDWAHKKKPKPIGDPRARNATEKQVLLAQRLSTTLRAA